jgi:hypothetical protein
LSSFFENALANQVNLRTAPKHQADTVALTASSAEHMKQDLASGKVTLPPEVVESLEGVAG